MLDLGTTWLASVARDPDATAIVDGTVRLTYAEWHERVAGVAAGFAAMGLVPGDHLVTLLQTRWEAATVHWAAQLAGLIYTPLDWTIGAEALAALLGDCEAPTLVYQPEALAARSVPPSIARIVLGAPGRGEIAFDDLLEEPANDAVPQVGSDAWSVMFYVHDAALGPCGVPRRHMAQRAAALAHVAHNQYGAGECLLGAMKLTEEAGLRVLLSAALLGGTFVCQADDEPAASVALIEQERISALHLGPDAYDAMLAHPEFLEADLGSVRRLCVAGPWLDDDLLRRLDAAFQPLLFTSEYGSAEVPLCAVNRDPLGRPGSAGRAGFGQLLRVVTADAMSAEDQAAPGEIGRIIALLAGDDAFEGYWRRPDADRSALHDGWFLTGDLGYFDAAGELYVTGRVSDTSAEMSAVPVHALNE